MTDKNLFKAFGEISPEYILEASPDNIRRTKKMSMKWIPLAACLCIIAIVGILALPKVGQPIGTSIEAPIGPNADVEKPWTPPEDITPPVSSGGDITPPDTPPDVTVPDPPPKGGSDTSFTREYIDEVYNLVVCDEAVGREVGDKWVNEVFLKLSPEEMDAVPNVYMMIVDLNISREALEEANRRLGGDELQQSTIEALYCGDVEEMKKALKNPLALYYDGNIYTFDKVRAKKYTEIPIDVLSEYFDSIESWCDKNGTLKYDLELIEAARLLYGIE